MVGLSSRKLGAFWKIQLTNFYLIRQQKPAPPSEGAFALLPGSEGALTSLGSARLGAYARAARQDMHDTAEEH